MRATAQTRRAVAAGFEMMGGMLQMAVDAVSYDGFRNARGGPLLIAKSGPGKAEMSEGKVRGAASSAAIARGLLGHDAIAQDADRRNLDFDRIPHLDRADTGGRPGHDDVAGKQRQVSAQVSDQVRHRK